MKSCRVGRKHKNTLSTFKEAEGLRGERGWGREWKWQAAGWAGRKSGVWHRAWVGRKMVKCSSNSTSKAGRSCTAIHPPPTHQPPLHTSSSGSFGSSGMKAQGLPALMGCPARQALCHCSPLSHMLRQTAAACWLCMAIGWLYSMRVPCGAAWSRGCGQGIHSMRDKACEGGCSQTAGRTERQAGSAHCRAGALQRGLSRDRLVLLTGSLWHTPCCCSQAGGAGVPDMAAASTSAGTPA